MLAGSGVACFENTLRKGFVFLDQNHESPFLQDKCDDFKYISVIWFNEDIPRLERHHARQKWSCLFREHSLQMLHKFLTKIMNHTFAQ